MDGVAILSSEHRAGPAEKWKRGLEDGTGTERKAVTGRDGLLVYRAV